MPHGSYLSNNHPQCPSYHNAQRVLHLRSRNPSQFPTLWLSIIPSLLHIPSFPDSALATSNSCSHLQAPVRNAPIHSRKHIPSHSASLSHLSPQTHAYPRFLIPHSLITILTESSHNLTFIIWSKSGRHHPQLHHWFNPQPIIRSLRPNTFPSNLPINPSHFMSQTQTHIVRLSIKITRQLLQFHPLRSTSTPIPSHKPTLNPNTPSSLTLKSSSVFTWT
jgi:hypothetical protein